MRCSFLVISSLDVIELAREVAILPFSSPIAYIPGFCVNLIRHIVAGQNIYLIIEVSTVNAYKFLLGSVQTSTVAISLIFFNVCTDLSASYKHSIIFGDFNADVFGVLPH